MNATLGLRTITVATATAVAMILLIVLIATDHAANAQGQTVVFSDEDHPDNQNTTRSANPEGSVVQGLLYPESDQDWFRFTAVEGATYRIRVDSREWSPGPNQCTTPDDCDFSQALNNPRILGVHDADGTGLLEPPGHVYMPPSSTQVMFLADAAGPHYIAIDGSPDWNRSSLSLTRGTYTLTVTTVTGEQADDFSARASTSGAATLGQPKGGAINYEGDVDWVQVNLVSGKTYKIEVRGNLSIQTPRRTVSGSSVSVNNVAHRLNTGLTLGDPVIQKIMVPPGDRPSQSASSRDDDSGLGKNALTWFKSDHTGKHYVVLSGHDRNGSTKGTYQLVVEELNLVPDTTYSSWSATNDVVTAGTTDGAVVGARKGKDCTTFSDVTGGGAIHADLSGGSDTDWYAADLEAGTTYQIFLQGEQDSHGTVSKPVLYGIYDAQGDPVPDNWSRYSCVSPQRIGSGSDQHASFHAPETARYYLRVTGKTSQDQGYYRLSVVKAPQTDTTGLDGSDVDDSKETMGVLATGTPVTGFINESWDRDWFKVQLTAGTTYRFDLKGVNHSQGGAGLKLRDPYIEGLYDNAGAYITGTTDDDGGAGRKARILYEAERTGPHYIGVRSDTPTRPWGSYELSVTTTNVSVYVETGSTPETAETLGTNSSVRGLLESDTDLDMYEVNLGSGWMWGFTFGGVTGQLGRASIQGLYDSAGNRISGSSMGATESGEQVTLLVRIPESGVYYIGVRASEEFDYVLSLARGRRIPEGIQPD